ncbi:CASP-like protein 1F2 [Bienertia sinuspersici]
MASNNGGSLLSNAFEAKYLLNSSYKSFFVAQIIIRSLTATLAIVSICVMVNGDQSTKVFGIELQAKYTYSSAFRFLFGTNIAICVFSVISLLLNICAYHGPKSNCKNYFSLFLADLIATILMMSGCAAATAIGYVGRYGQEQTGWTKICDNVKKFCNYISISIAFSYMAFICLFLLTIMAFKRSQQA